MNEQQQKQLVQQTLYFCTIKTNRGWQRSKSYASMGELLGAMSPYLTQNPTTTVSFQTEKRWA